MAVEKDIRIEQGDSKKLMDTITNAQDSLKPLNLSGSEVIWELYQEPFHKLLLSKSSANSEDVQIASASEGIVHIILRETDTRNLKAGGNYKYYIRVKDTFEQKSTVTKGKLFIEN